MLLLQAGGKHCIEHCIKHFGCIGGYPKCMLAQSEPKNYDVRCDGRQLRRTTRNRNDSDCKQERFELMMMTNDRWVERLALRTIWADDHGDERRRRPFRQPAAIKMAHHQARYRSQVGPDQAPGRADCPGADLSEVLIEPWAQSIASWPI